ncbi:MAG: transcriptional regulator [Candidatus Hydrogenedentota bacterium]|nr:MAG: transcriptional regulator [Candidatus Hydrogenedentota bacterium]
MCALENRRYPISEVSEMLDIPLHVLRQWEARFPQLKPKRDQANRRYYQPTDIEILRRIKQLLHDDKMTTQGASKRLTAEMRGEGAPQTNSEAQELIDTIDTEARKMLDILDNYDHD